MVRGSTHHLLRSFAGCVKLCRDMRPDLGCLICLWDLERGISSASRLRPFCTEIVWCVDQGSGI